MRKTLMVIMSLVLLTSLVGCGEKREIKNEEIHHQEIKSEEVIRKSIEDLEVGVSWKNSEEDGIYTDLDLEAFLLGEDNEVLDENSLIFYNNLETSDGSCRHSGDDSDKNSMNEKIDLNLGKLNSEISKVVFVVSTNQEDVENINDFKKISNGYIYIKDKNTNKELDKINLKDVYNEVTSMIICEVVLNDGEWKYNFVGQGFNTDLSVICGLYGLEVE